MTETLIQTPLLIMDHPRFVEGGAENTETLERFTEGLHELQADNPQIVGATLFGSRLKGEATAKSDVDCTILLDADQLAQAGVDVGVTDEGQITWGTHSQLRDDFASHFSKVLADKTDKDPGAIKSGIYVQPISEGLIEAQIDNHIDYLKKSAAHQVEFETWLDTMTTSDAPRPEQPDYVPIGGGIPALFSPDLLPGLDGYRQNVIDKLASVDEYGDKAWEDIMDRVRFGEGHLASNNPDYYPVNLTQAQEWYGNQSPENYNNH